MIIAVKLFAAVKQLAGREIVEVDIPDGGPVHDLRAALTQSFPDLGKLLPHTHIAVDQQYAAADQTLHADSEVACIPPVSGG